jgi:hypothetical protein
MIIKIYFTVMVILTVFYGIAWGLMNYDYKRSDMWEKISTICGLMVILLLLGGFLTLIWSDN